MEAYDVDGALSVLSRRIAMEPPSEATPYYVGAHLALNIIARHEDVRDQSVFMQLFDNKLLENGIRPIEEA